MNQSDIEYYTRACVRDLERQGFNQDSLKATWTFESDEARFRAWLTDSLLFALNHVANEPVLAFRGLMQAHEYKGRLGGFWPGPVTADCAGLLRNAIEAALPGQK
jgi:hypothetical protein